MLCYVHQAALMLWCAGTNVSCALIRHKCGQNCEIFSKFFRWMKWFLLCRNICCGQSISVQFQELSDFLKFLPVRNTMSCQVANEYTKIHSKHVVVACIILLIGNSPQLSQWTGGNLVTLSGTALPIQSTNEVTWCALGPKSLLHSHIAKLSSSC